MLRGFALFLVLATSLAFSTACVQSPTGPGLLYMGVKGPLQVAQGQSSVRKGESCARVILALFAWGDASIESAKRAGGITEVSTVDHESTNYIGFGSFCTVVYGQ